MTTTLRSGISALFRRLAPPNAPDCPADAALLSRFVQTQDEPAFAEIVRRHGAMVLSVCRRRLGHGPDADDAYQVTFLALARDARKIAARESLAGWLYRVAHLTALKVCGRTHRHRPEPLTSDPTAPMTPEPDADLKAVIDAELAALPDRFRGVAVLCLVEGLTNTEAADRLGIPKGTVDSRLSTAKAKLRDRLLKRGIAAAVVATVEVTLHTGTAMAGTRAAALASQLIPLALNYAAGTPVPGSEHLTSLADGVNPTMNAFSMKWLAATVLTAGLIGGAGVGAYHATADDKPQTEKKADPKKPPKADKSAAEPPKAELLANRPGLKTADDVQSALDAKFETDANSLTFGPLATLLNDRYGLTVRFDTPSFVRRGIGSSQIQELQQNAQIIMPTAKNLSVSDFLREALGQLSSQPVAMAGGEGGEAFRLSYRIKGNQLLIVPEYKPATTPGNNRGAEVEPTIFLKPSDIMENIYGEPVTVRYKNKPIAEVIEDLQERTGANIVLNATVWKAFPDAEQRAAAKITANFNDTRLFTVLKVVGNMCDLKPVVIDNVYYLTDETSADKLQKQVDRDLFGEAPVPVPVGFVTDGVRLFERPADLKPATNLPGFMNSATGKQFNAKPVPAPEVKKDEPKPVEKK